MRSPDYRAVLPLIVATVGLGAAIASALYLQRLNRGVGEVSLGHLAERAADRTRARMAIYEYGARGARGAVIGAGVEGVSRETFTRYSQSRDLAREFPGALGYGYVHRVSEGGEAAFVDAVRRDGRPTFSVRQVAPHAGDRFVVEHMEPAAQTQALIGVDLASQAETNAAAVAAMLSGEATLTPPLELGFAGHPGEIGVLLFLPVFRSQETPRTPVERQAATMGWTCATLTMADVIADLEAQAGEVTLALTDVTVPAEVPAPLVSSRPAPATTDLVDHRSFVLFGRTWRVDVAATSGFYAGLQQPKPHAIGTFVGLCGGFAALLIYLHGRRLDRHEARVRATEQRFRDLAEALPHMVWTCAGDGPCDYLSPQWVAYTGVPEREQLGYGWLERLHPDDVEPTKRRWAEAAAAGLPFDTEFRIRRFDGTYRVFKTRAVGVRDDAGNVARWFGSNTDVQDLRDAQDALLAANRGLEEGIKARTAELQNTNGKLRIASAQLEAAQRITNVGSWELDLASGEVIWSEELFHIFKLPLAAHAPHYSAQEDLFAPESWARLTSAIADSTATGKSYELTLNIVRTDGDPRSAVARGEALRGASGQIERLVGTFQDTTEREQAERHMRSVTERLQLATSAAKMGVWDWNVETNALLWDDTMHALYESADARRNVYEVWREAIHPEDLTAVEAGLTAAVLGPHEFNTTFRIVCPDGRVKHIRAFALAHRDSNGRAQRMVGLNWDVSEKREAELSLHRSEGMQRAILSHAGSAIIATNCEGVITLFNPAAEELLGYASADLVGKVSPGIFHDAKEVEARRVALEAELGKSIANPFDVFVEKTKNGDADAHEWT